jgi:Holliday junction DNA helicase RuvA
MIAQINGKLLSKRPGSVTIEVNGVGYEVNIPLSTYYKLPEPDQPVTLMTHTAIRDDSIQLYGFLRAEERELFYMLKGVSGIGPRLALNILSGMPVEDLIQAISASDLARLNALPGVGKKTAERLILELKDMVSVIAVPSGGGGVEAGVSGLDDDVLSALTNLGYKSARAREAVRKAMADAGEGAGFEELLKAALKILS